MTEPFKLNSSTSLTVDGHGRHDQRHFGSCCFIVADGRQQQVILQKPKTCFILFGYSFNTNTHRWTYPSERNHIESVLTPINSIQKITVADLWSRQHLQLTKSPNKPQISIGSVTSLQNGFAQRLLEVDSYLSIERWAWTGRYLEMFVFLCWAFCWWKGKTHYVRLFL